uniref:Translocase of outer mitochondrial membrane 40 homolog (yeast) n=1 Tax=Oryzias sinensis TaxID=183150 RepID=A0A8C7Y4G1_9TELE
MGSVLAAASPSPAPAAASGGQGVPGLVSVPPGFTMPPVSSVPSTTESGQEAGDADSSLPNPGTYEECHRKCKEVFPLQMEGVRLVVNKGLSNHFQVSHTVTLSTLGDSGYRFGSTYVGNKQTGPAELFPVLVGDMDNTGSLNAQIIHQLTKAVRTKIAIQTQQQKFVNWQCDMEYRGKDFTSAVTLGNPDVLVGSGIVVAHYLQSVTPALALGGELVYHRRPGEEGTVTSLLGRYTGDNFVATLTVGGAGAHATYYHKANEQVLHVRNLCTSQTLVFMPLTRFFFCKLAVKHKKHKKNTVFTKLMFQRFGLFFLNSVKLKTKFKLCFKASKCELVEVCFIPNFTAQNLHLIKKYKEGSSH